MIKKILIVLCVFVFLIGAGVFLYPSFRTAAQKQTAQAEIQRFENEGTATRADITRLTRRLGDDIAKVYGWDFPQHNRQRGDAR